MPFRRLVTPLEPDKESEWQRAIDRHVESWRNVFGDTPLPPIFQKHLDMRVRTEELAKAQEQVALKGQPVLGMTFCVNRRKEIARLAGNAVLRDNYTDLRTEKIFEKFRLNNSSGDHSPVLLRLRRHSRKGDTHLSRRVCVEK